jgi:F0F1-type ATP synthase assembly protein I
VLGARDHISRNEPVHTPRGRQAQSGRIGKWSKEFGPYLTLGLQLALSVVVFFFVGRWLDNWLGTSPWLMFTGLLMGIVGGFLHFFRTVIALGKEEDQKAEWQRKHEEREG